MASTSELLAKLLRSHACRTARGQIDQCMGHPLKGTCQEKKVVRKEEEAFFLSRRCGCENGRFYSSSEQPLPYRLFCSRSNLLPTLYGSLRFCFLLKMIPIESF